MRESVHRRAPTTRRLMLLPILALVWFVTTTASAQSPLLYTLTATTDPGTSVTTAAVVVVNAATGHEVARVAIGPVANVYGSTEMVGLAVRSGVVYATTQSDVVEINTATNTIAARFSAGAHPSSLAISSDGTRLFVNSGGGTISVVDTATRAVTGTMTMPGGVSRLILSPDGTRLFAPDSALNAVYIADTHSLSVATTVTTDSPLLQATINGDGSRIYAVHATSTWTPPALSQEMWLSEIDAASGATLRRMTLPVITPETIPAGGMLAPYPTQVGRLLFDTVGSRLYVAQERSMWRAGPTVFLSEGRLLAIDPVSLTVASTIPVGYGILLAAGATDLFVVTSGATSKIATATSEPTVLGNGVADGRDLGVVAAPSCWFEVWPLTRYVRNTAATLTIDVPAPTGCAWTATSSANWLTITSGTSGPGAGSVTATAAPTSVPRSTTVTITPSGLGARPVAVRQLIASTIIDSPPNNAVLTLPLAVTGWAADRVVGADASEYGPYGTGISSLRLWDEPNPGSGNTPAPVGFVFVVSRPDLAASFGEAYRNAGFTQSLARLGPGPHRLEVRATSVYDGTVTSSAVTVTIVRKPVVFIDSPKNASAVAQPFRLSGWAADATAPAGTGVDAVHVWAYPADGRAAVFVGATSYGSNRADVANYMGSDYGFANSGFEIAVWTLPPGDYTLRAFAHCTVTGTFDASAEVSLSVSGSPPPFGQVDTPTQYASGIVGAIGVTGWALDDVGVTGVKIYRNCMAFENQANCRVIGGYNVVYIGDAAFLAGARPDVEAAFPTYPSASRAGWGYLMLTNMLPHEYKQQAYGGHGSLTLYAFATDTQGQSTLLGRSTVDHTPTSIVLVNDVIAKPFGVIDTPGQGQAVSGSLANYGWALTPDADSVAGNGDIVIPTDGSTMRVFIDGAPVGQVAYDQCRGSAAVGNPVVPTAYCDDDVANIFGNPSPQPTFALRTSNATKFRNLDAGRGAIGAFAIDTRALANGLHTIAWGVTDSAGRAEGIGSRFFTVQNAAADTGDTAITSSSRPSVRLKADATGRDSVATERDSVATGRDSVATERDSVATGRDRVTGRTGFDLEAPFDIVPASEDGVRRVRLAELERLELDLGAVDAGYLVANGTRRDLPAGSRLDPATGRFTWAPGAGYVGTYRLAFVGDAGQVVVDVEIRPAEATPPGQSEIRMFVDLPRTGQTLSGSFVIAGWAFDPKAAIGSGIGAVHVWAQRRDVPGASAVFLGAADLGVARPDVGRAFGRAQFDTAGYGLTVSSLPPGRYDLTVFAWNRRTARWEDARTVHATVR